MAFSTATLTFLRGLKRHNDRAWFEAHRAVYEADVKQPMRELIEEMDVRLTRFAPEIIGEPKRSMFRIYRDIRFSPDKAPYKTHASCWFYHRDGSRAVGREAEGEGAGAGFYFQIARGDSFVGGGMWMPPRDALLKLREDHRQRPETIHQDRDRPAAGAPVRRLIRGSGAAPGTARLRAGPRGGPVAQVPVVRDGAGPDRRPGGARAAAGGAGGRFPPDAAAGAMDQRRVGVTGGGPPPVGAAPLSSLTVTRPSPSLPAHPARGNSDRAAAYTAASGAASSGPAPLPPPSPAADRAPGAPPPDRDRPRNPARSRGSPPPPPPSSRTTRSAAP